MNQKHVLEISCHAKSIKYIENQSQKLIQSKQPQKRNSYKTPYKKLPTQVLSKINTSCGQIYRKIPQTNKKDISNLNSNKMMDKYQLPSFLKGRHTMYNKISIQKQQQVISDNNNKCYHINSQNQLLKLNISNSFNNNDSYDKKMSKLTSTSTVQSLKSFCSQINNFNSLCQQKPKIIMIVQKLQQSQSYPKQYIQNKECCKKLSKQDKQIIQTLSKENNLYKIQINRLMQQNKELRKNQKTNNMLTLQKQLQKLKQNLYEKQITCSALQQKNKILQMNIVKKNQIIISQQNILKSQSRQLIKEIRLQNKKKKDKIIKFLIQFIEKQIPDNQYYKKQMDANKQNIQKNLLQFKQHIGLENSYTINQEIFAEFYQKNAVDANQKIYTTCQKNSNKLVFNQMTNQISFCEENNLTKKIKWTK